MIPAKIALVVMCASVIYLNLAIGIAAVLGIRKARQVALDSTVAQSGVLSIKSAIAWSAFAIALCAGADLLAIDYIAGGNEMVITLLFIPMGGGAFMFMQLVQVPKKAKEILIGLAALMCVASILISRFSALYFH